MKDLYLISVSGQGDTHNMLIEKDLWDWIHSPFDNKEIPQQLKDAIIETEGEFHPSDVHIGAMSYVNDRAMYCENMCEDDNVHSFYNKTVDMINFIKDNDINVVACWDGYIY
jgi:hypothetical protein